jgi:hypothetical protein
MDNHLFIQAKRVLSSLLLASNALGTARNTLSDTLTNSLGSIANPLSSARHGVS